MITTSPTGTGTPQRSDCSLLAQVDLLRLDASRKLARHKKMEMGQFFTPAWVAQLMASMFECREPVVHLLDAGAGVGSLFAAYVAEFCARGTRPKRIAIVAYEADPDLIRYIDQTIRLCQLECERAGIEFTAEVIEADFICSVAAMLNGDLFTPVPPKQFNCAILNPPYRKINSNSEARRLLHQIGIETSNTYTGFLAAAMRLLQPSGEMVAITPRSFCNGLYFKAFRKLLLKEMTLRHLHLFESRQEVFRDDDVLQETVIFHAIKGDHRSKPINVRSSLGIEAKGSSYTVDYEEVVVPNDAESFIRMVPNREDQQVAETMALLHSSLDDLGISVSTGRVVDFRAAALLRPEPEPGTAPLIYPGHFNNGYVAWPNAKTRKPNAIAVTDYSRELLIPNENYVLVKRFSSKEERRRVVAAVYEGYRVPGDMVAFENHLNYFHRAGKGLDITLAKGLVAFLNSTLVDSFFRQFSGHTQVNATDLRSMKYPTARQLEALGSRFSAEFPAQHDLDEIIQEELLASWPMSRA